MEDINKNILLYLVWRMLYVVILIMANVIIV